MALKFESLRLWQAALEYGEKINTIADNFPQKRII